MARRARNLRRLARRLLYFVLVPLGVVTLFLNIFAWVFQLLNIWFMQILLQILNIASAALLVVYALIQKLIRSIRRRIRELTEQAERRGLIQVVSV